MVNRTVVLTLVIATGVLSPSPAAGQAPEVSLAAGRVTVTAHETPLAAILDAWERRGGPRFVGAGRLPDRPVSVQFVDVPEREALRVLLRSAAGYVALPGTATRAGASAYDRVLIMTETASAAARRLPAAGSESAASTGGRQRLADPAAGASSPADLDALDVSEDFDDEDFDDLDELELVETLRRRYQAVAPAAEGDAAPSFRRQPDGSPLGTTPRPGMIIATEEPRSGPNPVRRRDRERR